MSESPVVFCIVKNSKTLIRTALFDGFITPVRTVTDLITHFTHLNALSTPTLELVRAATLSYWANRQRENQFQSLK